MKSFTNQMAIFVMTLSTCLLSSNIVIGQNWSMTSANGLHTPARIAVGGQATVPTTRRFNVSTSTDRIGMYIENSTPKGFNLGGANSLTGLCWPEGEDWENVILGLYAKIPDDAWLGYAGYFDGGIGVCGSISITEAGGWGGWQFTPKGDKLSLTGGSTTMDVSKTSSETLGGIDLSSRSSGGEHSAFSVGWRYGAGPYHASQFYVKGKGEAISKYGFTVYNGQNSHPIKMYGDPANGSPELFYVRSDGAIYSQSAVTIQSNGSGSVPYPFRMLGPNGAEICNVNQSGTIDSRGALRIHSPEGANWDAMVIYGPDGQSSYTKKFRVSKDGKVWSREVHVTQKDIPDYVFKDDYDLMPLSEIEEYVTEHKHLPNIPSEKEILRDGLNLGDQQMLHLEKIEELTLHLIAMNKRLEKLEKENEELKNELKDK